MQSSKMQTCRQSLLISICFILLTPDKPLIHSLESKVPALLNHSTEQNPKTYVSYLFDLVIFYSFIVLLGQQWCMSWSSGMETACF